MSTLDTAFAFFTEPVPDGQVQSVAAVLTSNSQGSLDSYVAAVASPGPKYTAPERFRDGTISGITPAKISFSMNSSYSSSGQSFVSVVTLTKQESEVPVALVPEYSITVTNLPAGTVESAASVDGQSGVILGSDAAQLITLAVQFSFTPAPPP
jgi:hypothetical protein